MPAPEDKLKGKETLKIVLRGPSGEVKTIRDVDLRKKDEKNG